MTEKGSEERQIQKRQKEKKIKRAAKARGKRTLKEEKRGHSKGKKLIAGAKREAKEQNKQNGK